MWPAALALLLSVAAGWTLLATLWPRPAGAGRDLILRLSLSLGLGLWVSSCGFFLALVCQFTAVWQIILIDLALLALTLLLWRLLRVESGGGGESGGKSEGESGGGGGGERLAAPGGSRGQSIAGHVLLLAAAGIAVGAIVTLYLVRPHGHWDAWAIWDLKARFFFHGGARWSNAFSDVIVWSHTDYPLLLPLNVARLWSYVGNDSTALPAAVSLLFTVLTVVTLYAAVARCKGSAQGALAALALLATGGVLRHGALQIADTPVGFYLLAALCALVVALPNDSGRLRPLVLAGLFAGAAAWTKNEGLLMAAALLVGTTLVVTWTAGKRRGWRSALVLALGLAVPLAFVIALKVGYAGRTDLLAGQSWSALAEKITAWSRHRLILVMAAKALLHVTGPLLPLALIAFAVTSGVGTLRAQRHLAAIGATLLLVVVGYYGIYLITPRDLLWHLQTSCDRLVVQLWPSMLLLLFATIRTPAQFAASWHRPRT